MDDITANIKDVSTTLGGLVASVVGVAQVFGYTIDPSILAKIDLQGVATAVVGVLLIFKVGGKK